MRGVWRGSVFQVSGVFEGDSHVVALGETWCHCQLQVTFKIFLAQLN